MASFNSIQMSSMVPAGSYSMAIVNIGGEWFSEVQGLLQAVSPPRYTAPADLVCFSESCITGSGRTTRQVAYQVGIWSQDWGALANYNWLFASQKITVASFGTIQATAWHPVRAEEMMYWFLMGGLAVRTMIEEKQTSGAVSWLRPGVTILSTPAKSNKSDRQNELTNWIEKLESLSRLAPGWNRQGAPAPSEEAIRVARQFIEAMVNNDQPPTRVAASAVGGVGVTRQVAERIVYIEFYNDGKACALLTDDEEDERVIDVAPKGGTYWKLLTEVKAYLNG
jgi:hypothetical protein